MRLQVLDRALVREIDQQLQDGASRAGEKLACRPGCTECCIGVFSITQLDAWRLRQGLAELEKTDPARARAVRRRAESAVHMLKHDFPGDPTTGLLGEGEDQLDAFTEKFSAQPCPALDPGSGLCDVYEHRPITCRTFGLPIRNGDEKLPPCTLCFKGSSDEELEKCRVEPDPDGLENAILCELLNGEGVDGPETIVAYAVIPDVRLASDDRTDESRAAR